MIAATTEMTKSTGVITLSCHISTADYHSVVQMG